VTAAFRPSPLALAVLGLLEAGPLHPYGIQQRIKQWGKDQVVNVWQRATVYKTISRLDAVGLITVHDTERNDRYPERTTYQVTESGRAAARQWLADVLASPRNEFPEFPAALSFLPLLTPDAARELLQQRLELLTKRLAEIDEQLATQLGDIALPRVTALETEYVRAVVDAERRWVSAVVDELSNGTLTWSRQQLDSIAATS
jgi:DNA-binding PadR family transcriptional regulator